MLYLDQTTVVVDGSHSVSLICTRKIGTRELGYFTECEDFMFLKPISNKEQEKTARSFNICKNKESYMTNKFQACKPFQPVNSEVGCYKIHNGKLITVYPDKKGTFMFDKLAEEIPAGQTWCGVIPSTSDDIPVRFAYVSGAVILQKLHKFAQDANHVIHVSDQYFDIFEHIEEKECKVLNHKITDRMETIVYESKDGIKFAVTATNWTGKPKTACYVKP